MRPPTQTSESSVSRIKNLSCPDTLLFWTRKVGHNCVWLTHVDLAAAEVRWRTKFNLSWGLISGLRGSACTQQHMKLEKWITFTRFCWMSMRLNSLIISYCYRILAFGYHHVLIWHKSSPGFTGKWRNFLRICANMTLIWFHYSFPFWHAACPLSLAQV